MVKPRFKRADTISVETNHLAAGAGCLGLSWILVLYLYLSAPSVGSATVRGLMQLQTGAPPVYGTREKIKSPSHPERETEIVYHVPNTGGEIRATALLLHGCYHHGRNFFSKSSTCEKCVGLSEELRITRILLEQESIAVIAITSNERRTGCWSDTDYDHVQDALEVFKSQHHLTGLPVLALGTSSGGVFGVQLAVRGIVDAALVGAMHLRDELVQKWIAMEKKPPVYIAAMPRDEEKLGKIQANFEAMNGQGPVVLDVDTCRPRTLDASFLNERVPNLSIASAQAIVSDLIEAGHIDAVTGLLVRDPTGGSESNWREVLKSGCGAPEWACLENQPLEMGESPLAKALNRAWAFHEYCSEVTIKALEFFEKELGGEPFLPVVPIGD